MQIAELDHFFVGAKDLEKSLALSCGALGFEVLPRPAARLSGYWLGVKGRVKVHLGLDEKALVDHEAGVPTRLGRNSNSVVDPIGFTATGPESFSEHFRQHRVPPNLVLDPTVASGVRAPAISTSRHSSTAAQIER